VVCSGAALATALACSDEGELSYEADVHPIFQDRCVICHYDGRDERSLENPFDADVTGMFTQQSRFFEGNHGGPQYDLVPGDPENSFLMLKITDRRLLPEAFDPNADPAVLAEGPTERGIFMPPRPAPMTEAQVDTVSQWIADGATDTQFFRDSVVPLLGEKDNFRGDFCGRGGYGFGCILCGRCHYDGAPTYPVLELPPLNVDDADSLVAEWLDNLVGAPAQYRPDLQLIVPGDPDASFLVMKMKAPSSSTALGAPMPYGFEPLSESQVEMLRTWIADGARRD
jgi:hypothetical protein